MDACSEHHGWETLPVKKEWIDHRNLIVCQAGFLIEQNDEYIALCMMWFPSDKLSADAFDNTIKIPTTWVKKFYVIKEFYCEAMDDSI